MEVGGIFQDADDLDQIVQKWPMAMENLSYVVCYLSDLFEEEQDINNNPKPGETERLVAAFGVALFVVALLYAILFGR